MSPEGGHTTRESEDDWGSGQEGFLPFKWRTSAAVEAARDPSAEGHMKRLRMYLRELRQGSHSLSCFNDTFESTILWVLGYAFNYPFVTWPILPQPSSECYKPSTFLERLITIISPATGYHFDVVTIRPMEISHASSDLRFLVMHFHQLIYQHLILYILIDCNCQLLYHYQILAPCPHNSPNFTPKSRYLFILNYILYSSYLSTT